MVLFRKMFVVLRWISRMWKELGIEFIFVELKGLIG
jgi:hypothetical protein